MSTSKVVVKRLSISFPEDIWDEMERISERQFRSIPSVILGEKTTGDHAGEVAVHDPPV